MNKTLIIIYCLVCFILFISFGYCIGNLNTKVSVPPQQVEFRVNTNNGLEVFVNRKHTLEVKIPFVNVHIIVHEDGSTSVSHLGAL